MSTTYYATIYVACPRRYATPIVDALRREADTVMFHAFQKHAEDEESIFLFVEQAIGVARQRGDGRDAQRLGARMRETIQRVVGGRYVEISVLDADKADWRAA